MRITQSDSIVKGVIDTCENIDVFDTTSAYNDVCAILDGGQAKNCLRYAVLGITRDREGEVVRIWYNDGMESKQLMRVLRTIANRDFITTKNWYGVVLGYFCRYLNETANKDIFPKWFSVRMANVKKMKDMSIHI